MNPREHLYKDLPDTPGVYLMKNAAGEVIYVGKAGNLKRRVSSYFTRPHDYRIERLVLEIASIETKHTDTAIEALILEAELIKTITPIFNVREKDDKSFLCIEITKEPFPRVILVRGKDVHQGNRFGPFTSATSLREALRIIRRIFHFNTHPPEKIGTFARPCFDAQIGLCPGTCVNAVSKKEYAKTVQRVKLFLEGKKARVVALLEKEMKAASRKQEYEEAEKLRQQIFSLRHIQDIALIKENEISVGEEKPFRIEGYDISNISGTASVGSMVVFEGSKPNKAEYRKFKIKTVTGSDDVGMLTEVLSRRFKRSVDAAGSPPVGGWPLPDLILVDGGIGQVNAARRVLSAAGLKIPLVGMAKGTKRKRTDVIGRVPAGVLLSTLKKVRDEAHRFAQSYHRNLRGRQFLEEAQ
jgi:excinuclease ABC subunit C